MFIDIFYLADPTVIWGAGTLTKDSEEDGRALNIVCSKGKTRVYGHDDIS